MINEMRREIIMENYMHPYHRKDVVGKEYVKVKQVSESCIDNIDLYVLFEEDKIKDLYFNGEACAISTSATSIMIKLLKDKTLDEAKELLRNYENMIEEKEYDAEKLGEALVYDDIYKQANRKGCALIPWKAFQKAIEGYESENK